MATQDEIRQLASMLYELHPAPFFTKVNDAMAGIGATLQVLHNASEDITAGKIAEIIGVSTARVAVLLKKMETRGLIVKTKSPTDARVTIVTLSEQGDKIAQEMRDNMYRKFGQVIDQVGMERLTEFFAVVREIALIDPRPEANMEECLIRKELE